MKIGYIYKTTNKITGEYYFGKREYQKDTQETDVYLGSGKLLRESINKYGKDNFTKEIIEECESREDLFNAESKYIHEHFNDPLCLNISNGSGWGGIYKVGTCSKCGRENVVLYRYHGDKCMKCLLDKSPEEYCEKCGKVTKRYLSTNQCRSCASKNAIEKRYCPICGKETNHSGSRCLNHYYKLVKNNDGTVSLVGNRGKVLVWDILPLVEAKRIETTTSVIYQMPKNYLSIKSNNEYVGLKSLIMNKKENMWLKITYAYNSKESSIRTLICTIDHPLPTIDGIVKKASELTLDDKLVNINRNPNDYQYLKIIKIEAYDYEGPSYDVETENEYFDLDDTILSHNCRSFLSPWYDETGKVKFEGRFNQGVVSINLPQIGILSGHNEEKFFDLLKARLQICFEALMFRHNQLLGTTSDVSPIHWQYGVIARLEPGETIDKYLMGGYSTISLGYIGVYEATILVKGCSHTEPEGTRFALRLMQYLKDTVAKWKEETNIGFALYGTPAESLCYRFCKIDKELYGDIPNVTDKGYYTNSYHVDVREHIDAFEKFKFEEQFQRLSTGGCISYAEFPSLMKNVESVKQIIKFIYNNIQYAEFNTKSDYCCECGYNGEMFINDDGKFECPVCHNNDRQKMYVTRRTCGYLGSNDWNKGKMAEFKQRYVHIGEEELK